MQQLQALQNILLRLRLHLLRRLHAPLQQLQVSGGGSCWWAVVAGAEWAARLVGAANVVAKRDSIQLQPPQSAAFIR